MEYGLHITMMGIVCILPSESARFKSYSAGVKWLEKRGYDIDGKKIEKPSTKGE